MNLYNEITTGECDIQANDIGIILALHYSYIDIFNDNPDYYYRGIKLSYDGTTFNLKFVINKYSEYGPEQKNTSDPLFNQQPRLLQEGITGVIR